MTAFLAKYKGYLLHTVAIAVVFLTPSVQAALAAHPAVAAVGGLAWGFVLHYFDGK